MLLGIISGVLILVNKKPSIVSVPNYQDIKINLSKIKRNV